MIVVKRKTVIYILVALCIGIFSVLQFGLSADESVECFTPATNKRIVVDFGHGLPDRRY